MNWLKKIGLFAANVATTAAGLGPLTNLLPGLLGSSAAGKVVSTGVNDLTLIGQVVLKLQVAFANVPGVTGEQKLQAAVALVKNIVLTSEMIAGQKVQNNDLFTQGCTELAQGAVDIYTSLHPDAIPAVPTPGQPVAATQPVKK